jgi:hypothetical protein
VVFWSGRGLRNRRRRFSNRAAPDGAAQRLVGGAERHLDGVLVDLASGRGRGGVSDQAEGPTAARPVNRFLEVPETLHRFGDERTGEVQHDGEQQHEDEATTPHVVVCYQSAEDGGGPLCALEEVTGPDDLANPVSVVTKVE